MQIFIHWLILIINLPIGVRIKSYKMRVNPSHFSPNLNFNNLQRIKIMQKLIKVNKDFLDNMVVFEYKDLNLIAQQVRAVKFQIDALTELLEQQGITCYGSTNKQVKLKDYQLDDKDNFIVKTSERSY